MRRMQRLRPARSRHRFARGGIAAGLTWTGLLTALVAVVLSLVAMTAVAANLLAPDTNAGQETLSGCDSGLIAIGGDIVYDITIDAVDYRVHEFRSAGTTTLQICSPISLEYLIVAGGGAGGFGGGGAGGVSTNLGSPSAQAVGDYAVTVGAGGLASDVSTVRRGGDSSFGSVTAAGGGAGGAAGDGGAGGSGGGAGSTDGVPGAGTPTQGNAGAATCTVDSTSNGGGGGGAGGIGQVSPSCSDGGAGGPGIDSIITVTTIL